MLTRRTLLAFAASTAAAFSHAGHVLAQAAAPAASDATALVKNLGDQLVTIVNAPGSYEQKKAELQRLIEADVDIDGVAQFCLGRFWRTATPQQQQDYLKIFHDVLVNNITGKVGQFQGVSFAMTQTQVRDADAYVGTLIRRPNQQPNNVQWVVETVGGRPKIVDVIAEGTSLRLTQRSDYASYLSRNGNSVDALLAALRKQIGG